MKKLTPISHDDEKTIEDTCLKKGWSGYKETWSKACEDYKSANGNPWQVDPAKFPKEVSKQLEELYDSRRRCGHIKRIRDRYVEGGCPVCGSLSRGDVDHYQPRSIFPEFSIYSLNLVPACTHCNSTQKGVIYRGDKHPARFIHPYFDDIASKPIYSVTFEKPYPAVRFKAVPSQELSGEELEIVRFHSSKILGDEFAKHMMDLWCGLPKTIAGGLAKREMGAQLSDVQSTVKILLSSSCYSYGLNSWPAGFYRGLLDNAEVMNFILKETNDFINQK